MKKLENYSPIIILLLLLVPTGLAQKVERPEPKYDRPRFEKASTSLVRPDFLACRNTDAALTRPGDLSVEEFARALHGVWINHNRRTVHGLPVETDAVFYIDMRGGKGSGILIDRNNLGDFPLTTPFLTRSRAIKKNARPLSMTYVNCTFQFLDQYIKVSDELPLQALAAGTRISLRRAGRQAEGSLPDIWQQLVSSGYFNSFNMVTDKGARVSRRKVATSQGDGVRVAVLPDGTMTSEKRIAEGMEPGGEYNLPMLTGALFQISLTSVDGKTLQGSQNKAVRMRWDGEYRGVGIDIKVGEPVMGIEQGDFFKEGNAIVSAVSISGPGAWMTSDCGAKNGLNPAEAVSNPGLVGTDPNLKPTLIFDRVVIGTP
jgi:hypothetical protein